MMEPAPHPEPLVLIGSPRLWERGQAIHDPRSREIALLEARLARALEEVRVHRPDLLSLGAQQIGELWRMCRIVLPEEGRALTLINPWVAEASLETVDGWEECASIPDLRFGIRRFRKVTIEYVDMTGSGRSIAAEGPLAALLQHEVDHFNGFLLSDRLVDSHRIEHSSHRGALARVVAGAVAEEITP